MENNTFLGGHLVGIGKIKKNGEIVYNELEKPVHNRITSVGLDHLFLFSGISRPDSASGVTLANYNNRLLSDKGGSSSKGYRAGVLNYMAFGSGNSATSFNDTALGNQIGDYIETKFTSTGTDQALNGTRSNSYGSYSFRVSHQSGTVSSSTTVNEIGWFGAYDSTSSYTNKVLFARVVLPSPITLESGESLITTYQLDQTESNTTASTISDFFGLKDNNDNTLQAEYKLVRKWASPSGSSSWAIAATEPYIKTDGAGAMTNETYGNGYHAPYAQAYAEAASATGTRRSGYFAYTTTSGISFPNEGSAPSQVSSFFDLGGGTYSQEPLTYNGVGSTNKYRDTVYTIGEMCPNFSVASSYIDISAIAINGMMYRFGYYDNGVWTPQMWRKYANQSVAFTFRTRYSTEDTTMS